VNQLLTLVMRFRRSSGLRPVNSYKAIIDATLLSVAAGVTSTIVLATAVDDYTGSSSTVPTGCKIHSIYLFVQILPSLLSSNVDWYVAKAPDSITTSPVGATGGTPFRKYILHEEKGIPGSASSGAYPLTFKGVIRIPKGRQRMAEGDDIFIKLTGADIHNICLKCIYKFYR